MAQCVEDALTWGAVSKPLHGQPLMQKGINCSREEGDMLFQELLEQPKCDCNILSMGLEEVSRGTGDGKSNTCYPLQCGHCKVEQSDPRMMCRELS
eukprot:15366945-Ditylum_brightwellii.AAC.1